MPLNSRDCPHRVRRPNKHPYRSFPVRGRPETDSKITISVKIWWTKSMESIIHHKTFPAACSCTGDITPSKDIAPFDTAVVIRHTPRASPFREMPVFRDPRMPQNNFLFFFRDPRMKKLKII